jgi:hypothetical protein
MERRAIMALYELTQDMNTNEAISANRAGMLTRDQVILLNRLTTTPRPKPRPSIILRNSLLALLFPLIVILLVVITGYRNLIFFVQQQTVTIILLMLVLLIIVIMIITLVMYRRRITEQLGSKDPLPFTSTIFNLSSEPGNDIFHSEGQITLSYDYRYEVRQPIVKLGVLEFPISVQLRDKLSLTSGYVILHYMKNVPGINTPILLSIEAVAHSQPPSITELQQVVGIGNDGELIFSHELYDVPDGEIVEIQSRVIPTGDL